MMLLLHTAADARTDEYLWPGASRQPAEAPLRYGCGLSLFHLISATGTALIISCHSGHQSSIGRRHVMPP